MAKVGSLHCDLETLTIGTAHTGLLGICLMVVVNAFLLQFVLACA